MKIASKTRLSLRKLFTAMLAVGPLAVLPSPVWAVLPTASSYTVTSGSATLSTSGNTVNINFGDKTILTWGTTAGTVAAPNRTATDGTTITNFVVDTGDTWNFASAGSILNKVVAGNNTTNGSLGGTAAAAIINGQLLGSNARVFVLANGGIVVGAGAQLNTQSLILSTLTGENDGTFITLGDLTYNGAASTGGTITIGAITGGGSITAVGSSVSLASGTVGGDLVLRAVTSGNAITLSAGGATTIGGNLTVTTNNGAVTQGVGNGVSVGAATSGTQTATFNTGTGSVTLTEVTNNFERVVANTSGTTGTVSLTDANIVTLGASNIGGDLSVVAGGQASTVAIGTDGAVVVGGNATFTSRSATTSNVTIGNNSSIAGTVNAQTSGGSVNLTLAGNLTLGTVKTDNAATTITSTGAAGAAFTALAGTATTNTTAGTVSGVTLTAGTTSPIFTGNVTVTISSPIAAATPLLQVTGLAITDGGSGYTAAPAITWPTLPTGAVAPVATATLTSGVVTSITLTSGGSGWSSFPTPTIAAPPAGGTQARVLTTANLSGISAPTNGGSGYTTGLATPVSIIGGGGAGATATVGTVNVAGDSITSFTLTGAGAGYTSMPSLVATHPNASAVGAAGRAVRDGTTTLITSVEITNAGVGYGATPPTITFPAVNTANNYGTGNITANVTGTLTNTGALTSGNVTNLRGSTVTTAAAITTATGNTQAAAVFTSNAGDITFGGATVTANRVTVNATGNVLVTTGGNLSTSGRLQDANSFTATGTISLDSASGVPIALGLGGNQSVNITAPSASVRSANNLTVGTANVTGNLTVRAGGTATTGSNRNITLGRAEGSEATTIIVGGVLTAITDGSGGITDNNDSRIEVFGGLNLMTGRNNGDASGAAMVAGGAITIDAATTPGALTPSVRFGQVHATTGVGGGAVTIAEGTTLNLGNITGASLTASSSQGGIIDTGAITLAAGGTAAFAVSGSNNVVIDTATNVIPVISVTGGVDNSFTALNAATTLASTTNSTGNTTISTNTGNPISIGTVVTTGNLIVNSGSYIDVVGTANITGNLTLNATGNVANASTFSSAYAGNVSINSTTGRLTAVGVSNPQMLSFVAAPTVTVVGGANPTTSPAPTATITNGIVTAVAGAGGTGYTIAPTVTLSAPPAGGTQATATATIAGGAVTGYTITNAGAGYAAAPIVTLTGGGSPTTVATVTANIGATGQIAGNNTFVVTNNATNGGAVPYVGGNPYRVDIAGATTTSILQSAGTLVVGGTTSISAPGNALLFRANDFNNVVLNNTTSGALINDVTSISVSGSAGGNLDVRSGSSGASGTSTITGQPILEANPWAVTLGNIAVGSLNVTAGNGGAANSGTITQLANTTVYSYGAASFTTTNNTITLGNNGNNFGRIAVNTNAGANVTITIVEDGTMKIGNLTGRGNTTLTSRFGGIIEDPAADVVITQNGTLTANAVNGSILLGNTTHTAGTTTANVVTLVANAPAGAVAITSNNSTTLGNITAMSLTAEVTGGNGNLAQSGRASIFGSATFSASNNITLTDNNNNFGRIFLTTTGTGSVISITEQATLNLGRVTMAASATGSFTATSIAGDIIDTGLGGVRPGGTIAAAGTGVVTLSAAAGNVMLDDPTTDFPTTGGVIFNANNVTLSPLGSVALYLGASGSTAVARGNLTVTSATGSLFNAGPLNVTGDATFQSGNGNILMTNASNNFGTVRFNAGSLPGAGNGIVSVTVAGNMSLVTGSSAVGPATFTTAGGNIDIVNRGGTISLASTGLFNASGNITLPRLIQVSDTLTVSAAGTKDLSRLSVAGDLNNKAPQNFGTGTYLPPLP